MLGQFSSVQQGPVVGSEKPNDVARQRFPFQLQIGGEGVSRLGKSKFLLKCVSVISTAFSMSGRLTEGGKGRLLTGRLQGLSRTTSSSER